MEPQIYVEEIKCLMGMVESNFIVLRGNGNIRVTHVDWGLLL
jgi:hypothetical protein